ncbi:MAG: hypothetical protein HY965_01260 [Ignavibacteriales bacterium]|nr:hypothetical protein [Ignavibacteriales bacterium]
MAANSRSIFIWAIAILVTLGSVYYQRATGPSYPVKGELNIEGTVIQYKLERSHVTGSDYEITIPVINKSITGIVTWHRYNSDDEWQQLLLKNDGSQLSATIPSQPPAGKVEYMVTLMTDRSTAQLTIEPVVMRFRGDVPAYILIPHIICMFLMFLFSNRTGLEYFNAKPSYKTYVVLTMVFIIAGGMILGPITQKFAFGVYWSGVPFGYDLTDNKTLIALLAWLPALRKVFSRQDAGKWILAAAIISLIIFLIPHSVLGSELNYRK